MHTQPAVGHQDFSDFKNSLFTDYVGQSGTATLKRKRRKKEMEKLKG